MGETTNWLIFVWCALVLVQLSSIGNKLTEIANLLRQKNSS